MINDIISRWIALLTAPNDDGDLKPSSHAAAAINNLLLGIYELAPDLLPGLHLSTSGTGDVRVSWISGVRFVEVVAMKDGRMCLSYIHDADCVFTYEVSLERVIDRLRWMREA